MSRRFFLGAQGDARYAAVCAAHALDWHGVDAAEAARGVAQLRQLVEEADRGQLEDQAARAAGWLAYRHERSPDGEWLRRFEALRGEGEPDDDDAELLFLDALEGHAVGPDERLRAAARLGLAPALDELASESQDEQVTQCLRQAAERGFVPCLFSLAVSLVEDGGVWLDPPVPGAGLEALWWSAMDIRHNARWADPEAPVWSQVQWKAGSNLPGAINYLNALRAEARGDEDLAAALFVKARAEGLEGLDPASAQLVLRRGLVTVLLGSGDSGCAIGRASKSWLYERKVWTIVAELATDGLR